MTEEVTITQDEINTLAGKLQPFAEQLTEQERQVLGWIIARASMAREDDVAGYTTGGLPTPALPGFGPGLPSRLGQAAGFGRGPTGTEADAVKVKVEVEF
ncbi:MAG: hypothetical protein ACRDJE_23720 [Dehalococcoidia bacterium]